MIVGITGASGFVGTNLKLYFSKLNRVSVKAISRQSIGPVSIIDKNNLNVIVHLAGKAHDLKKVADPGEYDSANFELTKKLYNAFLASTAKKFIFISSVKAVADTVEGVLTEDHVPSPETPYGKSKLLAEQYIQSKDLPAGKSYFILRPSMIHGPGNKGNLNLLYNFVKRGIPYPFAGFDNKRSFLSIENLCFVISELTGRDDIKSGIYNVADDEALSTNQVVAIISSSLKMKKRYWTIRPSIILFLAKIGDKLHLPLTTERLKKLTENYMVSNMKIKQAIKKELPLNSIDGLSITIDSFNKVSTGHVT